MDNFNEYQCSTIKLKLPTTGEVFNVGVILMDENGKNRKIKTIGSFQSIAKCLKIEEADSHDYILQKLEKYYKRDNFEFDTNFSNTLHVEAPSWINSEKSIEEELQVTFEEMVTISHSNKHGKIGEYTSQSIVTKLKSIADTKSMKNIGFRKNTGIAHKRIDAITNLKDEFLVAGEVCSPHTDNFMQHWSSSTMALNQLIESNKIKVCLMYLPIIKMISGQLKLNYNYAKDYSNRRGIRVIDSKYPENFLAEIEKETKKYGQSLFE